MKDRQDLNNSMEGTLDALTNNMEPEWNKPEETIPQLPDDLNDNVEEVQNIRSMNRKPRKTDNYGYGQYFLLDYLALRNS